MTEGVDGLLPNLDYINTVRHIARWAGGCDAVPHHYTAEEASSSPRAYIDALGGLVTHARTQASGAVHGPEAVFARYGVDSMALYAVPAEGPHGFYSIGRSVHGGLSETDSLRTTESTLRSLNNLLERFHQSFFLYSLVAPDRFVSVGTYVASPILASAALTFLGLRGAATSSSLRPALLVGLASLALGAIVMALRMPLGVVGVCAVAIASRTLRPTARVDPAVVRLEAGVVIAVAAAVNFGRGALLAAAIGPALLAVASRAPIRLAGLSSTALAVYLVDVRAAATPFAGLVVAPLLAQTFAAALYK